MAITYEELLEEVATAQASLDEAIRALHGDEARAASTLPGWTRGHVITHLARNADAVLRLAQGVLTGALAQMYPGGTEARNAAIEEGADRPITLLVGDSQFSGARLLAVLPLIDEGLRDTDVPWRPDRSVTADFLPVMRWREIEIHHVDLDVGYTPNSWGASFVEHTLELELPKLTKKAPDVEVPELDPSDTLAWLIGRPTRPDLPEVPVWP